MAGEDNKTNSNIEVSKITLNVCLACGNNIDNGLCGYTCMYDATDLAKRPEGSYEARVYEYTYTRGK